MPPGTASAHEAGHCIKHVHVAMPGGGHATVSPDIQPRTIEALAKVAHAASIRESVALHRIVSDECRENRGDINIMRMLSSELGARLIDALGGWPKGQGTKFEVKLTIIRENSKDSHPELGES